MKEGETRAGMAHATPRPWKWMQDDGSIGGGPEHEWDGAYHEYEEEVGLDFVSLAGPSGETILYGVWHNDSTAGIGVERKDAELIVRAVNAHDDLLATVETLASAIREFGNGSVELQRFRHEAEALIARAKA